MPEAHRPPEDLPADDTRALLSALADGQADALAQACQAWRDDPQARQTWRTYHLIGDVLRSDELARHPGRDEDFLAGLRQRLAAEPVPLAPSPAPPPVPRRQPWLVPVAAAAGFVVVAGVLVVSRLGAPGAAAGSPTLAAASGAAVTLVGMAARPAASAVRSGEGTLIRDARLDEYLRAHQSARGGVAVAAPGGLLRQVDAVAPAGAPR